jgi:hypothetical protein
MRSPGTVLRWQGFGLPKRGHAADEYEDAFAGNADAGRFAVADGASESSFAGEWARLLVEAYVRTPGHWAGWLPGLRDRWAAALRDRPLPWYAEAKAEEGAFATLLGLQVGPPRADGRRLWQAEAVGDSCLFHLRRDRLLRAFPVARSADFANQPDLVGSRPPGGRYPRPKRHRVRGTWRPHDHLLLMTDALAQWFLEHVEAGRQPWDLVVSLQTESAFAAWVEGLRDRREPRNDDVTLLRIGLE